MNESVQLERLLDTKEKLLVSTLMRHPAVSRSVLAGLTGLQPSVVGDVATRLIAKHYLVDLGVENKVREQAGRPGRCLEINNAHWLIFALDIEPDVIRIGLFSLTCEVVAYAEHMLDRFSSNKEVTSVIESAVKTLLDGNENWRGRICGAGASLPGRVDVKCGILEQTTNMPNVKSLAVGDLIRRLLNTSLYGVRSTHAACLAEKWRRPAETMERNILCLTLRTGVGTAFMTQGRLYRGASGMDGEIGHTTMDMHGELCECGKRGCLETLVGSSAIKRRGEALMKTPEGEALRKATNGDSSRLNSKIIYKLVHDKDPGCTALVREVTHILGIAVANLVETLDPHEVVICGAIDEAEDVILDEMRRVFDEYLLPDIRRDVRILISPLRGRTSLYGAAASILDAILT